MKQIIKKKLETCRDEIIRKITASRGPRKGQLLKSKPKADGLTQYIWRMATFHSGQDPCMPVMAEYDLWTWAEKQAGEKIPYTEHAKQRDEIHNIIEPFVDDVLDELGYDKYGAARRWAGLI